MTHAPRSAVAAMLVSAAVAHAAPTPEQAELGERWLQIAQRFAARPEGRGVARALADVAGPWAEGQPRLLRTAADVRLAVGDRDGAIDLLTQLRRADPGDQIAQIQSIDLQQSRLESVPDRIDYLTKVAGSDRVPAEVRSHAAVLLAAAETERGRDDAARVAVDQALSLNPWNPKALQLRNDAVAANGMAAERAAVLVSLLKVDPLQFATASRLGEELLRAGLTEQAAELYRNFLEAVAAAGFGPSSDDSINAATALQAAGRPRDAVDAASSALKDDPADLRLHALRLLLTKAQNDDAGFTSALADARTQALRNLMGLHTRVDAKAAKPDDNTPAALPDVKADAAALAAGPDRALADAYLRALGDLAWVDTFYGQRAPDAAVVEAITSLAGKDGVLTHRVAGYAALAANRPDEADVAFSPVAARDPLSRLGLLTLKLKQNGDKTAVLADAGRLLAELPTDVWPLVIRQAVKDAGTPSFRTPDAGAVAAEYAKLPKDVLSFSANGRSAYLFDITPLGGGTEIGQPVLVRVTLQNTGELPLVLGPGGAIDQAIALDASARGQAEQTFPGVAAAKLTQRLVVMPRQSVTAEVRLDGPELAAFLAQTPQAGMSVFVSGVSNPVARQNAVVPGPGGFRAQARGVIDRPLVAFNRPEVRDALTKQLADPDALRRVRAVAAVGACAQYLATATTDDAKALSQTAAGLLRTAAKDASPVVRAAALQATASLASDADRKAAIATLLAAPDLETRVTGTLMTVGLPQADRQTLLKSLADDADPKVKALAVAVASLPDVPKPQN